MVRKLTLQGNIDFAGPEAVFNILFGSDEFVKRYHKKINSEPNAEVSSWNENHEREVKYLALTEAPKMITKLIGESFPVTETQKRSKNGDCYTITCTPRIDSPSGERVFSHAETILSPDECGGCVVTSNITLECKGGAWGLEGAVESFMESSAKTGFENWLKIAKSFCEEKLAAAGGTREVDSNQECFFDAQEGSGNLTSLAVETQMPADQSSTSINGILHRFKAAFSAAPTEDTHALDSYFVRTVLREVNDIHISCDALKGHVEKLNAKMLKMEDELSGVRLALERKHVAMSKKKQLTLLGASFATGFGLGYMFFRMKRQS